MKQLYCLFLYWFKLILLKLDETNDEKIAFVTTIKGSAAIYNFRQKKQPTLFRQ